MKKTIFYVKDNQIVESKVAKKTKEKRYRYEFFGGQTEIEVDCVVLQDGGVMSVGDVFTSQLDALNHLLKTQEANRKREAKRIAGDLRNIANRLSPEKGCDCDD